MNTDLTRKEQPLPKVYRTVKSSPHVGTISREAAAMAVRNLHKEQPSGESPRAAAAFHEKSKKKSTKLTAA